MSRSYKKHPYNTDGSPGTTKEMKRFANKTVRKHKKKLTNGTSYKRLFCSYNIHDYILRWTWAEAKHEYEHNPWPFWKDKYPTLKEFYKYWSKHYKRK